MAAGNLNANAQFNYCYRRCRRVMLFATITIVVMFSKMHHLSSPEPHHTADLILTLYSLLKRFIRPATSCHVALQVYAAIPHDIR